MNILQIAKNVMDLLISWGINPLVILIALAFGCFNVFIVDLAKKIPLPKIIKAYFFAVPMVGALLLAWLYIFVVKALIGFSVSYYLFAAMSIYCIGQIAYKLWEKWQKKHGMTDG